MSVELLYFHGCPHAEALLPHLRSILEQEGSEMDLHLVRVETLEHAEQLRFLGSPTVRVHGHDIEAGAARRDDFGLKCRIYQTPGGLTGTPPDDWIRAAVRKRHPA